MLRPNAHCGEVRKGNFVPVSHCAKSPEGARRSAQYVFGVPARAGRIIHRGGQVEPGQQAVRSGRRSCHAAVLVAVSRGWKSSRDDSPSGRNSTSADSGGGADSRGLDSPRGTQRAIREITPSSLGATGAARLSPVLVVRFGISRPRTRSTTSGRAASVTTWNLSNLNNGEPIWCQL